MLPMSPKVAVVCGAHTAPGLYVVRQLLNSPQISHVHALTERDLSSSLPPGTRTPRNKLRQHIAPLQSLERTIARNVRQADLAFCVASSPNDGILPASADAYQLHCVLVDIPLRFFHEMNRLSAFSVAMLSHPSATRGARATPNRLRAELVHAARETQMLAAPAAPRLAFFNVAVLILDGDRSPDGLPPLDVAPRSLLDRVRLKAAIKQAAAPGRIVHVRDLAKAMVADALDSLDQYMHLSPQLTNYSSHATPSPVLDAAASEDALSNQSNSQSPTASLTAADHFAVLGGMAIIEMANAARALHRRRRSRRRDFHDMRSKMSEFARTTSGLPPHSPSAWRDDEHNESAHAQPSSEAETQSQLHSDSDLSDTAVQQSAKKATRVPPPVTHSAHAMGHQLRRPLTKVRNNAYMHDAHAPSDGLASPRGAQSHEYDQDREQSDQRFTADMDDATGARFSGSTPSRRRSFHSSTTRRQSFARTSMTKSFYSSERSRRQSAAPSATQDTRPHFVDRLVRFVAAASERPSTRRRREAEENRRLDRFQIRVRGNGDMRPVGQTTI